jgi:hypothetical protein
MGTKPAKNLEAAIPKFQVVPYGDFLDVGTDIEWGPIIR